MSIKRHDVKRFMFWCQKVLPLVYDNSLSYYEVLCKVVDYINDLIESDKAIVDNVSELRKDVDELQNWVDNYDEKVEEIIKGEIDKYIATMVFFGLTDDGYFTVYIPSSWKNVSFYTTELDIFLDIQPEYGHLVLAY